MRIRRALTALPDSGATFMKTRWSSMQSTRSRGVGGGGRNRSLVGKAGIESLEPRQLMAIITVNTTADTSTAGATLSLRQAIEISDGTLAVSALSTQEQSQVAGAIGSSNTIDFDIPESDSGYNAATGVWTIAPTSSLPAIQANAAIINGYSQFGASANMLARATTPRC